MLIRSLKISALIDYFKKLPPKITITIIVVMTLAVSLYLHFGLITLDTFSFLNYTLSIFLLISLNFLPNKFLQISRIFKNKNLYFFYKNKLRSFRSTVLMLISIFLLFFISFLKLSAVSSMGYLNQDFILSTLNLSFKSKDWYIFSVNWLKFRASKVESVTHISIFTENSPRLGRVLNILLKRAYSWEEELYDKWINSYSTFRLDISEIIVNSNISYFKSLDFFKSFILFFVHYLPVSNEVYHNFKKYAYSGRITEWDELVRSIRNFTMIYNIIHFLLVSIPNDLSSLVLKLLIFINKIVFLDGVSMWLLWLVVTVCYILSLNNKKKYNTKYNFIYKKYYIYNSLLDIILVLMVICFLVKNIFIFFIAFEAILLPLFIYIIFQGSRLNKIFAIKYLVIYTVIGSMFLWFAVIYLLDIIGNTDYNYIQWSLSNFVDSGTRKIIFLLLFFGFAIKVPMVPFHHWLTIAHVEAPTNGSIILAALLLKVGTYGLYRFIYNLMPIESFFFSGEISALAIFGFTYATVLAVRQIDVKRYIAYTSIAHMNFSILGLFSCTEIGLLGYLHTTISHGIIATAMFYLIGHLYSILHFRDTIRISGISQKFPKFSIFFFLFSMANMGLPLFSGFVGEFFIITSLIQTNEIFALLICAGFMISGIYNIFQINRLLFSDSPSSILFKKNEDLDSLSLLILTVLFFWSLIFGILPDIILKSIEIGNF